MDIRSPPESPKHISKSLQNIQSACVESRTGKKPDQTVTFHRRTQSTSLNPHSALILQRSQSYQPPHSNNVPISSEENANAGSNGDKIIGSNEKDIDKETGISPDKWRLVIVSSKIRNISSIRHALHSSVILVPYNYDSLTLDDLESQINLTLTGRKVLSAAFILSCSGAALQLVAKEEKIINKDGCSDKAVQDFFSSFAQNSFTSSFNSSHSHRIDFLAWYGLPHSDISLPVVSDLQKLTGVTVGVWRDLTGHSSFFHHGSSETGMQICVGELYFRMEKLRNWSGHHQQSLAGFEKIRTVGKGAYGAAVLYKKKDDDSLVILKEINMHDLNVSERQLALNEINVLAMLDHPNIISYFDSFEEDGVLMIEMEYADNGTLAHYLSKQESSLEEKVILMMFQQIVAAIRHIHSHNILHRDLKTDNIFLTKEGVIKIGDFGISKIMGSGNNGAQTVLGTPYYISPEMCEGKSYSFKSDIWALGCILYEVACLQKTFEGTNLPALVNKIMKGQFEPVRGNYSEGFKDLVSAMLKRDPEQRPEANSIMYHMLPPLMNKVAYNSDQDLESFSSENIDKKMKIRSVLYYLEASTAKLTCIGDLPPRMKIKNMSVGPDHVIVTTIERQVFSWGLGQHGQLGHGDTNDRYIPTLIEALKGKSVTLVCCGHGFSIFGSDNGLVLTCGDGTNGCLGHGDWSSINRPRLIESLLSFDVTAMACGMNHVVVLGRKGCVLSWGDNSAGQLGLGTEENQCVPSNVQISEPVIFINIYCSVDGTMLLSDVGSVFACGNNENNKLGLNNRQGFLMAMKNIFTKTEVDGKNVPTAVRALARHRVLDVSMGNFHTAVIVEPGHVITFGKNMEGQLGTQNIKSSSAPVEVKVLEGKCVNHIQCGDHYTVAGTKDHELYYWGLRYTLPFAVKYEDTTSQSSTNDSSGTFLKHSWQKDLNGAVGTGNLLTSDISHGSISIEKEDNKEDSKNIKNEVKSPDTEQERSLIPYNINDSQGFRPLSSVPKRSMSASSQDGSKEKEKDKDKDKEKDLIIREGSVIIFNPMEIIKLRQGNEKMLLGNIFCHGENLFIQVETTAPPPRRKTFKKKILRRKSSQLITSDTANVPEPQRLIGKHEEHSCSSETSEIDTHSSIPAWLKEELAQCAADINDGNEPDDTSAQSEEDRWVGGIDSSLSSIQINRALTPVGSSDLTYNAHTQSQTFISGVKCSPRNQILFISPRTQACSLQSSESNPDASNMDLGSDNSSGELRAIKKKLEAKSRIKTATVAKSSHSKAVNKPKSATKGRGCSQPLFFNEHAGGRGFISDVTAKRREESLMYELERMKEEKRLADARIRLLEKEREHQIDLLKQEALKVNREREIDLVSELEKLKNEVETQNCLLEDRQRVVQDLQEKLNQVIQEQHRISNGLDTTPRTPRPTVDADELSADQQTPRATSSASSSSSKKSTSRMCCIQ